MEIKTLEVKIDGIVDLINEKFKNNDACHDIVLAQVKYTNGRVRLLEKCIWACGGAITIIAFVVNVIK